MRKRTVQSVLARRHMFKNGGMVPPQAQPAGILASSPSLVDAVSNDALSDMGGGTLSMAQGGAAVNMQPSYVFNQGGIAKFNPGGFADKNAIALNAVRKVLNGSANLNDVDIVKKSPFADDEKVINAIKKLGPIPLSPGLNIGDYINEQPGEQVAQLKVPVDKLKIGNLSKEDMKIPPQEGTYLSEGEKAIIENANNAVFRPVPNGMDASVVPVTQGDLPPAKLGPPPDGTGASVVPVTQGDLPPAADRPYIAGIDDLGAEGGSQGFIKELAEATNKNTETNAAQAVFDIDDMGGEGGSVGADQETTTVTDFDSGQRKQVNDNLLFSQIKINGKNTDEDITVPLTESIVNDGTNLIKGEPTNMDSLKKRIEALIPAVEEDPQTQGLLIAMLGASIAGGESPNAFKNISDGMQKALPGLINFGMKQKAAKRNRQTEIGKLVLGEELQIIREGRADKRAIAKEGRKIIDYISGPTVQKLANGKEIPPLSPRSMTRDEYNSLKKRNPDLKMYPQSLIKKLDLQKDIIGKPTLKDMSKRAELLNKFMTRDNNPSKPFAAYKSEVQLPRLTLNAAGKIMLPENLADAKALGMTRTVEVKNPNTGKMEEKEIINLGSVADENDVKRFTGEYQRLAGGYQTIYGELQKLYQLTDKVKGKASLVGPIGNIMSRVGDAAAAFAEDGVPGAALLRDYALGVGQKYSPQTAFEAQGRLTLAKITPMILGESGKTISDADRVRVARALGYQIDKDINGKDVIGALTTNIFTSEASVRKALSEVSNVIRGSYLDIHKIYQQEMISVGREIKPLDEKTTKKLRFSLVPKKVPKKGP